ALGIRVVEHEPFAQQRRVVIERGAVQKQIAFAVDKDLRAFRTLEDLVAEPRLTLPGECVAEAGAAAAFHAYTKTAVGDALLGHQRLDLFRRGLADLDHVSIGPAKAGPYAL